jgi:hypothetical protein
VLGNPLILGSYGEPVIHLSTAAPGSAPCLFRAQSVCLSAAGALQCGMADNRTISQLEADGYPWIGCECCKGTVWVPFRMLRERLPTLSAMTLDQLGARMRCDKCGERPERYYPANQSDTPGFVRSSQ